jgi:hypothetical protein
VKREALIVALPWSPGALDAVACPVSGENDVDSAASARFPSVVSGDSTAASVRLTDQDAVGSLSSAARCSFAKRINARSWWNA